MDIVGENSMLNIFSIYKTMSKLNHERNGKAQYKDKFIYF